MKASLFKAKAASPSRQKASNSIRGKISGPIPIPNPVDEEFPIRNPGTNLATPIPPDVKEPQFPPPPEQTLPSSAAAPTEEVQPSSTTAQNAPGVVSGAQPEVAHTSTKESDTAHTPPRSTTRESAGPSPASGGTGNSPQRRTNQSAAVRYSMVSASSQRTGNTGNKDGPQRKKSTLRGALSKLFGRKKKRSSESSGELGSSQHRSDPTALNRAAKDIEPKRSASLPITEYDRALRSHSVGPEDIIAIESARNSMNAEYTFARRRANTTNSHLYTPRTRDDEFGGLSPRPASTHGRGSRMLPGEEDPDEIGRAITSDAVGLRRRSRSLSGLPDAVDGRGEVRRRSDEIRYWRESYDPAFMSPISSNAPENDDTGVISTIDMAQEMPGDRAKTPPQPFHFGSLATMNEMAGMKITQAASLETRLTNLEARMRRMERVVTQLANTVPDFRMQVDPPGTEATKPPPGSSMAVAASDQSIAYTSSTAPLSLSLYQTAPLQHRPGTGYSTSRRSEDSRLSFGDGQTFIGSNHPQGTLPVPQGTTRPTSNSTVRGTTSLPTLPRDVGSTVAGDNYTTLLMLIKTERAQRELLEAKVRNLSQTLERFIGQPPIQLEPPPTSRSFGGQSAFDADSSDDEEEDDAEEQKEAAIGGGDKTGPKVVKPEDSGIAPGQDLDEDEYSETFATPREEQPRTFGAFGEELRIDEGDPTRKKAARTLSLSQLTDGKPGAVHPARAMGGEF